MMNTTGNTKSPSENRIGVGGRGTPEGQGLARRFARGGRELQQRPVTKFTDEEAGGLTGAGAFQGQ